MILDTDIDISWRERIMSSVTRALECQNGLDVLATDYSCGMGACDVIAFDGTHGSVHVLNIEANMLSEGADYIVSPQMPSEEEIARLKRVAETYLLQIGLDCALLLDPIRVGVVGLSIISCGDNPGDGQAVCGLIKDVENLPEDWSLTREMVERQIFAHVSDVKEQGIFPEFGEIFNDRDGWFAGWDEPVSKPC